MAKRRTEKKKREITRIVRERIEILFKLAKKEAKENPKRARRYISLIRKLSTRHNVRLTRRQRMLFCRKCNSFWIPGYNVRVRLRKRGKKAEYACACGNTALFAIQKR
jgi:ribonuclease P protein subunit RPR2